MNQYVLPAPTTNPATQAAELAAQNQRRPYYNRFSSVYDGTTQVCCTQNINSLPPAARENYNNGSGAAHQLWSSAMVISPVMRGMFGLAWDVPHHTLDVTPHLPADWAGATIRQLPFGRGTITLTFARQDQELVMEASGPGADGLILHSEVAGARVAGHTLHIPCRRWKRRCTSTCRTSTPRRGR